MQVVGLQNWVSKLQIHVESQTSTFLHHRRETVTTLLTERGLVSKLSARGRMVGVRHKLMPHPISKYFSVSFFFFSELFKLNNIWSSWNKENHSHEGGLDRFWRFSFSVYPIVFFFLIEKIYQTLETVFHRLSNHLDFRQKYFAAGHILALFSVFEYPDETMSLVFDMLLPNRTKTV